MTETDKTEINEINTAVEKGEDTIADAEIVTPKDVDTDISTQAPKAGRRKYGKIALGFTALSALIIGGASGGGFVRYVMPILSPAAPTEMAEIKAIDMAPFDTKIHRLTEKNTALEAELASLKTAQAGTKVFLEDVVSNIETLDGQGADVLALTSRLEALEKTPIAIPIDETLLTRLEALQDEGSQVLDLSAIEARLSAIEGAVQAAKTQADQVSDPVQILEAVQERLELLSENQVEIEGKLAAQIADLSDEIKSMRAAQDAPVLPTNLPSEVSEQQAATIVQFPKRALLDALAAQSQTKQKPLLKRALDKHIKIKDPSNPAVIIEMIEKDLAQGDTSSALKAFDSLPLNIRNAGQIWRNQFQ